jgi:transcription antitermination protein NusB
MATGERPPTGRFGRSAARRGGSRGAGPSSRSPTRLETRARSRALQALYAWDVRSHAGTETRSRRTSAASTVSLTRVAGEVWDDLAVAPEERRLANRLLAVIAERQAQLDEELAAVATNWRLSRMSVVDRCVLRLAAGELTEGTTPARVVIAEAVRLAERYGTSQSARFVNGVLDALARRMDRL